MNGDFFTIESFSTLAGITVIVVVVSGVIQHVFNINPKWLSLFISCLLSFLGVFLSNKIGAEYYLMAFLNGFLIYANVVGINQITGKNIDNDKVKNVPYGATDSTKIKRNFRTKWF